MSFLRNSPIWTVDIFHFKGHQLDFKGLKSCQKIFSLPHKKIRKSKKDPHTYADPFLFIWQNVLYLFVETKSFNSPGKIECYFSENFKDFEHFGVILEGDLHYSFPNIFEDKGCVYMIPETSQANEISLYKFIQFPNNIQKISTLLEGNFFDTAVFKKNNIYYLLSSNQNGLQLFFSEHLESGFKSHPDNPITKDLHFSRNAGGVLNYRNKLYRFSQNCKEFYGENVNVHEITYVDERRYKEVLLQNNIFQIAGRSLGSHHLSFAENDKDFFIAIDSKKRDLILNKIFSLLYRFHA